MVHQVFGLELIFGFTVFQLMGILLGAIGGGFLAKFAYKIHQIKNQAQEIEGLLSGRACVEEDMDGDVTDMITDMAEMTEQMGLDIEEVNNLEEGQELEQNLSERWENE